MDQTELTPQEQRVVFCIFIVVMGALCFLILESYGVFGQSMMNRTSFGEYFDDQRDRMEQAMQNKNTQLWNEWRERYDERERKKQEEFFKNELDKCSEKGVEISQECKVYFKKKFETTSEKNDEKTKENSERS